MSPRYDGNNFEGSNSLPATLRHQGRPRGRDFYPQMTEVGVVDRSERPDGWLESDFDADTIEAEWEAARNGWKDDDGRVISRLLEVGDDWEVRVLSDDERETVARARAACALEEARA